jgi:hypothetical protein
MRQQQEKKLNREEAKGAKVFFEREGAEERRRRA